MNEQRIPSTVWHGVGLYVEVDGYGGFMEPRMGCHYRLLIDGVSVSGALLNWKVIDASA